MAQLSDFDTDYLRLTLEVEKHIPGYVDAFIGPPAIKAEVEAGERKPPAGLLDDLKRLQDSIPTADPAREAYLTAELRAVEGTLRILDGEEFDYLKEVEWLYDVRPGMVDEETFTTAHKELDTLLPGTGSLSARVEARRKRYELATEQVMPLLELARRETRERTTRLVDLVDGEGMDVRLTSDQPWGAYNWFLGDAHSLIEFNTDVPVSALSILSTFAHEGYPGHHTEHMLKEKVLYKEKGYGEEASFLLHSPAAVIAEGIATTAIEIIFPDGAHHQWNADVLLPAANKEVDPPEKMRRIANATRNLRYVSGNAAILYHTGQTTKKQTIAYIQAYGLANPQRAEKSFSFISNPLFRSYVFTYTQGYDLIAQAAGDGDKTPLFLRLLVEQILPSQLIQLDTDENG